MPASAGDGGYVEVSVHAMSGEAVLPRGPMLADLTVGGLAARLWRSGGPPETRRLLLGGREVEAHERLGDLEVQNAEEGLTLTVLRQGIDPTLVGKVMLGQDPRRLYLAWRADVGDADLAFVGFLLQDPACRLEEIDLSNTSVADVTPLAGALQVNKSLRYLHLHSTQVSDVSKLAEALKTNTTLEHLDLGRTLVREVGALVEALRVNRSLTWLGLVGCPLSDRASEALSEVGRKTR